MHFLNFVLLFYLQVLLVIILPVSFLTFFHLQLLRITLANISFVFQIKNANLSRIFLVCYDVTSLSTNISLQETIDIAINLTFNHNDNLNITKKELKKLFLFATSQTLAIGFIIKLMEQPWFLLWFLLLLIFHGFLQI